MRNKENAKLGWKIAKILVKAYMSISTPFPSQFSVPIQHRFPTLSDQFSDLFQPIF